jgi:hypothetical protein
MATVYIVVADGKLVPLRVVTGLTDGAYTEVRSRDLAAGQLVVVGAAPRKGQAAQQMNAPAGLGGGPMRGPGGPGGGGRRRGF